MAYLFRLMNDFYLMEVPITNMYQTTTKATAINHCRLIHQQLAINPSAKVFFSLVISQTFVMSRAKDCCSMSLVNMYLYNFLALSIIY